MTLKLFGNLVSQPTRAAAWLMTIKKLPYELQVVRPPNGVTPEFLQMNPNGLVPVIKDGDFSLFEGNAILVYLSDKHKWTDMYPVDVKARAKVNEYLHWHHSHARQATTHVLRPFLMTMRGKGTPAMEELVRTKDETLGRSVRIMETLLIKPYIAQSEKPTIADLACYCEFDTIELMDAFDFSKYPKTAAWMKRMKDVPYHDEIRADLTAFLAKMMKPKE